MANKNLTAKGLVVLLSGAAPEKIEGIIEAFLADYNISVVEASEAEILKLTKERDAALASVTELSQQIADQSTVKSESELLVKVGGDNYLLDRATMHTINGPVTAEDAAKDEKFLKSLIKSGAGNIRLAK